MRMFYMGKIVLPDVKSLSLKEARQVNAEGLKNTVLNMVWELEVDVNNKHTGLMGDSVSSNLHMKREVANLKQEISLISLPCFSHHLES